MTRSTDTCYLLIDIGNSRLKWTLAYGTTLEVSRAVTYKTTTDTQASLSLAWHNLPIPALIGLSCVGSKTIKQQIQSLCQQLWPNTPITQPQSVATFGTLYNAYPEPQRLGIDRWLALIAAQQLFPNGACVVDCGTALTIDVMNNQGQHLGGLISPGLQLMRQALAMGTAALPLADYNQSPDLANATHPAINSGTLLAAAGFIETAVQRYALDYPLLLCGGDAALLMPLLHYQAMLVPDLVLKGLLIAILE